MNQALRYTIGLPFFVARKVLANPICWADEFFASGKPTRKPIKLEMEVSEYLDKNDEKTRIEEEIRQRLTDAATGSKALSQLSLYGYTEIVLVLKDAHKHPTLQLKPHVFTDPIRAAWDSLVGIQAVVHTQGEPTSEKSPSVVLSLSLPKAQPTLAAVR